MSVIKNEKGTFVELPKDKITFCGDTEEERKSNELIFDLTMENDALTQEIDRLNNIINELEKWLIGMKQINFEDYYSALSDVLDKLKELKDKE